MTMWLLLAACIGSVRAGWPGAAAVTGFFGDTHSGWDELQSIFNPEGALDNPEATGHDNFMTIVQAVSDLLPENKDTLRDLAGLGPRLEKAEKGAEALLRDLPKGLAKLKDAMGGAMGGITDAIGISSTDRKLKGVEETVPGPYFRFLPSFEGSLLSGASPIKWSGSCFAENTASVEVINDGVAAWLTIDAQKPKSLFCYDWYLIATEEAFHLKTIYAHGTHKILWPITTLDPVLNADIKNNGFRVFRFMDGHFQLLSDLYETVELFLPALTHATVPEKCEKANHDFLAEYTGFDMPLRPIQNVELPESEIQDGDFFGVLRLDGLDPMLGWGMGARTGHTTTALHINGTLHVCESTSKSAYWPVNGIQCTPYAKWIELANTASYQVVHLPLSPEMRKKFDSEAAVKFVRTQLGLNYGYNNMLFCWVDTPEANYPFPLVSEMHRFIIVAADAISKALGNKMWVYALNFRVGIDCAKTPDQCLDAVNVFHLAESRGVSFTDLMKIPEQDSWVYPSGPQSVCDVFVCKVWKAAGLFGDLADEIQCTEFTNWDDYTLNFFDSNYKLPEQCKKADPDLPYCQLLGKYRLDLGPDYNTRAPHAKMTDACPRGTEPIFDKPTHC